MHRSYHGSLESIPETIATSAPDQSNGQPHVSDTHLPVPIERDRSEGVGSGDDSGEPPESPRIRTASDDSEDNEVNLEIQRAVQIEKMEKLTLSGSSTKEIGSEDINSVHESVTKCSICMDKFRNPKSLPCFHTFCQPCLARYISQFFQREKDSTWNNFPCPTCRSNSAPADTTVDVTMWAEQFPTNHFILSVMDMMSFEKAEKSCDSCDRQQKHGVKAEMWCTHCKVCLCKKCLSFHDAIFLDHRPLSISKAKKEPSLIVQGQEMLCTQHKENMTLFCHDHQVLACTACVAVDHRRCLRVTTSKDYLKEFQPSREQDRVIREYNECLDCLENIAQENMQQSSHISNRKQEIINKISECRQQINKHFDEIQIRLMADVNDIHREETQKFDMQIREIRQLQTAVEHSKKMVEATVSFGGDSQVVSVLLNARRNTQTYKQKAIETFENTEDVNYSFRIDDQISKLPSLIKEFGKIKVVRTKRGVPKSVTNMKQMFERKVNEVHKFFVRLPSDNIDCVITSGLYRPDGRLIICDFHNRCVKMFRDTGVFITKLLLQTEPFGICMVDNTSAAVSCPNSREITIISISEDNITVLSTLKIEKVCYGIEKFNDEFIVLLPMDKPLSSMCTVDLKGAVTKTINKASSGYAMFEHRPFHLTVNKHTNEIYVTQKTTAANEKRGVIIKQNLDVKHDIYHKDIRWARGIEIDFEENLYICGQMSSNVVQFTPDCSQSRVLLTASDGIQHPAAIGFNHNKFFLTDVGDNNRNIMKIFELI